MDRRDRATVIHLLEEVTKMQATLRAMEDEMTARLDVQRRAMVEQFASLADLFRDSQAQLAEQVATLRGLIEELEE